MGIFDLNQGKKLDLMVCGNWLNLIELETYIMVVVYYTVCYSTAKMQCYSY